jgi:serine/threonine protein kinase
MTAPCHSLDSASAESSGCNLVQRTPELTPGDVVGGKYVLLRPLGTGGMGEVWMATNASTGADVAVKALLPELALSSAALARFRDEAYATAMLSHRGIVRVFDLVEVAPGAGSLLIVMELLRGHTLAQRLATLGPLCVAEALAVALPILSALSHAHGAGIVHRDVKPDNVFLSIEPDGQVFPKLVDFGISQLRQWGASSPSDGIVVGTPWYMSPEQARGEEVDARCDVFGVGVLLYECLSGINPLRIGEATSSAGERSGPVPLGAVPASLRAVIARALAERREDRFSTAAELAEALSAVSEAGSSWTLVSSRPRVRVLSVLALALVAAAVAYRSDSRTASAQEQRHAHAVLAAHPAKEMAEGRDLLVEVGTPTPLEVSARKRSLRSSRAAVIGQHRCPDLLRDPGF